MNLARAAIMIAILEARAIAAPNAETLYAQGQDAYDHASYTVAIEKWTQAYELSRAPGLLFNVAQAQRLNGDCVHALSSYRRFVDADPTSEQRALADDFVGELEPKCGAPIQTLRVDRNTKPGHTLKLAGLATGGAGIALLVTGFAVGRHANALGNEVSDACASSCDWAIQKSKDAAGRRDAVVGYALDTVGLAAIAGGVVMYYVGRRNAVTVAPTARDGGAVVLWSGSW